jgi:hypothetical protein
MTCASTGERLESHRSSFGWSGIIDVHAAPGTTSHYNVAHTIDFVPWQKKTPNRA